MPPDTLHHPRQFLDVTRRRQQMDMVSHQHITMDRHLELLSRIAQTAKKTHIIFGIMENPHADQHHAG